MLHPARRNSRHAGTGGSASAGLEGANNMSWADFYLLCFIVGVSLSFISVLGGFLHIPGLHHARHGHVRMGHRGGPGAQISPINFSTITAFLAWFGAVGYLLTRFSSLWMWF